MIFIITSLFLGIIITFYYNKNINLSFILTALLITIIFYIIFYFLGSTKIEKFSNDMNFNNYYKYNDSDSNNFNIFDYLEDDENTLQPKASPYLLIPEEDNKNIIEEEVEIIESPSINNVEPVMELPKETIQYNTSPDLNNIIMNTPTPGNFPIPSTNGYGPLNINISYNSQNKANEIDTHKKENIKIEEDNVFLHKRNMNRNLGEINSRIHNNSDWVYGQNAWTNNPDYYIPNKDIDKFNNSTNNNSSNNNDANNDVNNDSNNNSNNNSNSNINNILFQQSDLIKKQNNKVYNIPQFLNNIINNPNNKYHNNGKVCPMSINTPWTEYMSGDSEPEPFNL